MMIELVKYLFKEVSIFWKFSMTVSLLSRFPNEQSRERLKRTTIFHSLAFQTKGK